MFGVAADIRILDGVHAGAVQSFLTAHKTREGAEVSLNWLNANVDYNGPVNGPGFTYEFLTLPVIVEGKDFDTALRFHGGHVIACN